MTDQIFKTIICSRNCQDFILLYDGLESRYFLYYNEDLIFDIVENLNPKEYHKEYLQYLPYLEYKKEVKNELANKILDAIVEIIGDDSKNHRQIMAIYIDLVRTLKDAKVDHNYNEEYFANAPGVVIEKSRELSASANYDADALDKIVTPKSIEEEINARANPVLTKEEKAKADAIAEEINQKGLLPFLKENLDKIHIGKHKNIYRKTLAEFKKMRGELRYIGETNAKQEAGKSFEDEIVYKTIIPQRYIFEVNKITEAAFTTYASNNIKYFDRMTLLLGDYGGKNSFKKIEGLLDIIKPLITEGFYRYDKSDKEDNTKLIQLPLEVDGFGAVYQTTKNSFTEDDAQLESRTIYSTPPKVEPKDIARQIFYLRNPNTRQSRAKADAEKNLKNFGLYLMQMVNTDIEIINPYFDVFWEYASKSETPIREVNQQLELFDAYCILTKDKAVNEAYGYIFASEEQLKEYMDFVNLENALIPYEYDFLNMLLAKGKSKELTILYNDFDLNNEDGTLKEDIDLDVITTLTECENNALELINTKMRHKFKNKLKSNGFNEAEIEEKLKDYEPIETKGDLNPNQVKEMPQKLLAIYGFRNAGADHKSNIFFRFTDLKNYYGKRTAYKNIDNVPQLLQSLHNKGYLGKYEIKQGKENLYYLTPKCENLTTDFELKKSYDRYVTDYYAEGDLYLKP